MRWFICFSVLAIPVAGRSEPPDFDKSIAPIIIAKCIDCHSGSEAKGKLDLSRRASSSKVVAPGNLAESELWHRVSENEMPPKKPLSDGEKQLLKAWIEAGAKWGTDPIDPFTHSTETRSGRDWWAYQPLKQPPQRATLDSLIADGFRSQGGTLPQKADARTLIRRAYYDVIGMPPTPQEIAAFEKDPSDAAYRKMVEHLLASPHYGERWARHWLDLVRYGESDGFERNEPRPTAWHYRDWVIRALNDDMPYDRFAKLQLAGDVLEPNNPDSIKATGFLVAGIHNTVVGSNPVMRENARQDELEDLIGTVGQSFLGLTVQCARCHDHKYDPITQLDYYQLSASLGGVHPGQRRVELPELERKTTTLRSQIHDAERRLQKLEGAVIQRIAKPIERESSRLVVAPIARWSFEVNAKDSIGELHGNLQPEAKIENGRLLLDGKAAYVTTPPLPRAIREKTLEVWVRLRTLDQGGGGAMTLQTASGAIFDSIVFGERQAKKWMAGSNNFLRTRDLVGDVETESDTFVHMAVTYAADGLVSVYRQGKPYGSAYKPGTTVNFPAKESQIVFGLRHTGGGRGFLRGEIEEARLYDRALTTQEVASSHSTGAHAKVITEKELLAAMNADERQQRASLIEDRTRLEKELLAIPVTPTVYAVTPKAVPKTHLLARGNVEQPRDEVAPGTLSLLRQSSYSLPKNATEGERRAKLANGIASRENPLFARVIANRLWQQHFGTGIVTTPSDFGFNGGRPSHPELLDYLATQLIHNGWSLKHLHRLILTSEAYQQKSRSVSVPTAKNAKVHVRKFPTRLDAETIRDSILVVTGQLNTKLGGPPFHDVRSYANNGTTFYEPIDPVGAEFNRRTIYRFSPRGERSALLEGFDCPDPSAQTPRRQITTTPLQSLALWNNSFVLRMAEEFAKRVEADCAKVGDATTAAKIRRSYNLALGRMPTEGELKDAEVLIEKHGLKSLARVLFNCNEFIVID